MNDPRGFGSSLSLRVLEALIRLWDRSFRCGSRSRIWRKKPAFRSPQFRALAGYSDVSEKTRQLIMATAQQMGYQPNLLAHLFRLI